MSKKDFSLSITLDQSPKEVFNAVTNPRGWWSENITGGTAALDDEFTYRYQDIHTCRIKLTEVVPDKKVVWYVLDNDFNFTKDKTEWKNTKVIFDISKKGNKTQLDFTHEGLVPEYECYGACVKGWTHYVQNSLSDLVTTGKGQPNGKEAAYTVYEVALQFNELAKQEKWFDIQDRLFADDVKSIEPENSPYMNNAYGKTAVRKKADDFVKRVEVVHRLATSEPIITGNHFAVTREKDLTVQGLGRIQINEIMLYEVKNGKIVSEQFFY